MTTGDGGTLLEDKNVNESRLLGFLASGAGTLLWLARAACI